MVKEITYEIIKIINTTKSKFLLHQEKISALISDGWKYTQIVEFLSKQYNVTFTYYQFRYWVEKYNLSSLKNKSTHPKTAEEQTVLSAPEQNPPVDNDISLSKGIAVSKNNEPGKFVHKPGRGQQQIAKLLALADAQKHEDQTGKK